MKTKDLIGKTIANITPMHKPWYDDQAWLKFSFTDGTSCILEAYYQEYTGHSECEYPAFIQVVAEVEDLVPDERTEEDREFKPSPIEPIRIIE